MDSSLIYYALGLLIVAGLVWFRTRGQGADGVYDAFAQFQDALDVAPQIVMAVEQLWQTGILPDKNERLNEAMRQLGEWFPDLTETQLRTAIEMGVYALKQGVHVLDIDLPDMLDLTERQN